MREEASGGGSEEEMELRGEGDGQGREHGMAGNIKGGILRRTLSILYTAHKTTHNPALAFETLIYKMVNGYINTVS